MLLRTCDDCSILEAVILVHRIPPLVVRVALAVRRGAADVVESKNKKQDIFVL